MSFECCAWLGLSLFRWYSCPVFGAKEQEILAGACEKALNECGLTKEDIGVHSSRKVINTAVIDNTHHCLVSHVSCVFSLKGGASFVSGQSTLVNIVALLIRGDWDMGVQNSYFFRNPAADSNMGRLLAGLPQFEKEFAIMPPQFKHGTNEERIKAAMSEVFSNVWPTDVDPPAHTQAVLRMCLARMLYSADWIKENVTDMKHHVVRT